MFSLTTNAFGLDISDFALRLVSLKRKGLKNTLATYSEVKVPPGNIVGGEIKNPSTVVKLIDKLIKTAQGEKITTKEVVAVLPEPKTFIKLIEIPNTPTEQIPDAVKEELENHIPMSLEEIYFDWQIVSEPEATTKKLKVLTGTAPKKIVDSYLQVLEQAKLIPLVLEIEAAAITRSLLPEKEKASKAKIIIDIGAVRTGLIVCNQGVVQFTVSLPISGNQITEKIAETLKIDDKKAEKAKKVCGLDEKKCKGALKKILFGNIDDLTARVKKAINFYKNYFLVNGQISEIILCGGGAYFVNIDKVLSEKLQIPTKVGNPFTNIKTDKKDLSIPSNKVLSYTTALGLALRGLQKDIF